MYLCLLPGTVLTASATSTNSSWYSRFWQTDDGLPNNIVTALTQTQDGYLWVGTPAGLARFDGDHFSDFLYQTEKINSHPSVHTLQASARGGLWVVPSRGAVVHLNRELLPEVLPANLPDASALFVAEDRNGCPWIAYNNGILCRVKSGVVTQFTTKDGLPGGTIESLISDSEGNIWVAKGTHIHVLDNGAFRQVVALRSESHIAAARSNGIWIVTGHRLLKCDSTGRLEDMGNYLPDTSRVVAREAIEDHTGAVWIGTDSDGLYRYSQTGFEKIETSYVYVSSLAEDSEGNVWAGTLGGGLDRVSRGGIKLEKVSEGSSFQPVQSVCEDTNGLLWGATQDGLLVSRVEGEWRPALTNVSVPRGVACVAADRNGAVWLGMRNAKALYCWQGDHVVTWDDKKGYAGNTVASLFPDSRGDLWVGINAYRDAPPMIQRLHGGQFQTFKLPPNEERVIAMAEDYAGNVWAGTSSGQLFRYNGKQLIDETARTGDSDRSIRSLYTTADGALWIGYGGLGLACLKENHFTRVTTEQGLRENWISQIVADDEGWLWFGSDHGIFKVRQIELEQVVEGKLARLTPIFYGRNEGLFNLQINYGFWPGAIRTQDGQVAMPTRTALAMIEPAALRRHYKPPKVLLTAVVVDDQTIAAYGIPGTQIVTGLPLRLPPSHHNLRFEFTAFNFSEPENVHFRYRLDNLDNDWQDAEAREAQYSRLAAGDYHFRVEAATGDGTWNEVEAPLTIVVDPFFWQTWTFRIGAAVFFVASVVGVVRYVSFRRLRRKLQLLAQQAALDKERTRIARDLHDDLGGRLTEVKQLFELALRNHASPEAMHQYLRRGLTKTQSGIQALDETVWAVNPHNDTLPYLIDYIGQSAVEFLRAADIRCRADLPPSPPERNISAEARHNLFLTVKEALNNVVRHAHASEVQLNAVVTDEALTLTIKDNGKGFERAPANSTEDGLRNMRQRMEEIGGNFSLESKPGSGTSVSLTYFWPAQKPGENAKTNGKE
jgi:signal transduction histidine kinase/ligand-binding sensor domain-containing protein